MEKDEIKKVVKKFYKDIVIHGSTSCCCSNSDCDDETLNKKIAQSVGYSDEEINSASDANLGLGCGNPVAMGNIKEGDVVLDLGSGAGFDCFLASKKTGAIGKVIGVDITQEMIDRAKQNAIKFKYENIEFRLGDIEKLPVENDSIDVIISNCVINLAPDKSKVFKEAYRVLKKGGKAYVSDIVLLQDLSEEIKNDEYLIGGCVGGAILKDEYIKCAESAGLKIKILSEDKEISKRQYEGLPLESLKIEATK